MSNIEAGRLFEREMLAVCQTGWNGHSYVSFQQALWLVENNQPWDPTDPSTRAAEDLHCQVALALGLEDFTELSFLSALGSPLDLFHGVDGLFEWKGGIVTIDLTVDPNKVNYKADLSSNQIRYRSDVIIRPEDENDNWQSAGRRIASLLQTRKGAYAA